MESWIAETGLDGFNLAYVVTPETFADIADLLVPELQRRGRYKTEYAPGTLREKLFPGRRTAAGRSAPRRRLPPRLGEGRRMSAVPVIRDDADAIATARALAADFALTAAERDRDRRLPRAEIDRFSQSGLWAITVPRDYGGAGVSAATLAEVTAIMSAADGSIGQIPQNHYFVVEAIRLTATEAQKRHWFGRVLAGDRFGNALSEVGTKDGA